MLISKIFYDISECIILSESNNLTNEEEKNLSILLAQRFDKLIKFTLAKSEKRKLFKYHRIQRYWQTLINPKFELKNILVWVSFLNISTSLILIFFSNSKLKKKLIVNEFKFLTKSTHMRQFPDFHTIVCPKISTITEQSHWNQYMLKSITHYGLQGAIIPSTLLAGFGQMECSRHMSNILSIHQCFIVFEISCESHFTDIINTLIDYLKRHHLGRFGLLIHLNARIAIRQIAHFLNQIPPHQSQQLNIFVTNSGSNFNFSSHNKVQSDAYFKWSIYTLMNFARKKKFKLIINTINLFDIAWCISLRAQLNIEKNIQFGVQNIDFSLNKIFYSFGVPFVKIAPFFLSQNVNQTFDLIMENVKLKNVSHLYSSEELGCQKDIFIKGHDRFFRYLNHNFLKKYLNAFGM
jgi:hypothetical protein